ncbi:hypothetical protein [Acidovorax sp. SUPP3334]|uniref:hypothetical protein n=1 Tax=Acidovorax sp. SUPP3334 TaxID=2920881 RepID=UPI0023DE5E3B|nr:hypothetical protein [Acidovorax sp. SUPP3334]GKT25103.1 hypothetical protein AVHM3334_16875 [Acidovorax sp. SUPP3334]
MNVGFDRHNLANATEKLISLAKERTPETHRFINGELKRFDLTTEEGAKDYLMSIAEDVYAKSGKGVVAQIRAVVYYSIGVVFEVAEGTMHPPSLARGEGKPAHVAYFWQVL